MRRVWRYGTLRNICIGPAIDSQGGPKANNSSHRNIDGGYDDQQYSCSIVQPGRSRF